MACGNGIEMPNNKVASVNRGWLGEKMLNFATTCEYKGMVIAERLSRQIHR